MEEGCVAASKGGSSSVEDRDLIDLPPGFRFHPTDEEIITYYLTEKVMNSNFVASAIGDADLNKCEPWDLPKKAKMGEKEWYFFCQRDRKYPTGMRTNRATESGYWKATGKDKEIFKGNIKGSSSSSSSSSCLVGMKKTLVFYKGRAPKGEKSNWVMHEYRLEGKFSYYNLPKSAKDEWVVCRVFHKNMGNNNNINKKMNNISPNNIIPHGLLRINSLGVDDMLDCSNSLPPLTDDPPPYNPTTTTTTNTTTTNYANDNHFRQTTSNYFYYSPSQQNPANISSFYSQQMMIPVQNSLPYNNTNFFQGNNNNNNNPNLGYDHHHHHLGHCKVEQFSNNMSNHESVVSVSQDDTGLSTDNMNNTTEISSVVSHKQADHDHDRRHNHNHIENSTATNTPSFHVGLISGFDDQDAVFWDGL